MVETNGREICLAPITALKKFCFILLSFLTNRHENGYQTPFILTFHEKCTLFTVLRKSLCANSHFFAHCDIFIALKLNKEEKQIAPFIFVASFL